LAILESRFSYSSSPIHFSSCYSEEFPGDFTEREFESTQTWIGSLFESSDCLSIQRNP